MEFSLFFLMLFEVYKNVQGRANRSSLITSRNNGKNLTLSPLQTHPVVPALGPRADSQNSDSPTSASSLPKGLKPLRLVSRCISASAFYCLIPSPQSTIIDAKYPLRPNNHSRMHSPSSNSVYSFHSGKFLVLECMSLRWKLTLLPQEISIANLLHLQV